MEDCPWARAHSAGSWQSHWSGNSVLQQRMHRAQRKGIEEQQSSDEEVSAPSPAQVHTHLPVAGLSSPHAGSLQDARLGKRKAREVESIDFLPPRKRPHTNHTRSKPSIQPKDEHDQAGPAEPRPSYQPSSGPFARVSTKSAQTATRDLPLLCSPSKCSTPIPHLRIPLPVSTSTPRSPVVLLPPAIIRQSPAKSKDNSTNDQSGLPSRPPTTPSLRQWTQNRAGFVSIDLSLEFSGDEQEEQEQEKEVNYTISGSRRNENQSKNGDEDSDKTEPNTDTDLYGSETNDDSRPDDSEVGMDTEDYAMPWRRCLRAILSPPSDKHCTGPIQRGNKDQVLVPASQSTNSQPTGNSNSQASAQQLQLGLRHQAEAGPSQRVDPGPRSVESTDALSQSQKEQEVVSDTSCVPDSQDDISLLGPSSHLSCDPSSSLPSGVPELRLRQPGHHPKLEDEPLSQPSQSSQLTDPNFVPGNASFDEYTDPLEFTIGVGSQPEVALELKDEVDQLGRVVHYEDTGYALRDRESMRRSESGASKGTDTTTLIGDYFEVKEEEIKKEAEESHESQLTRTEGSQCQPLQPRPSESQGSQPAVPPVPIQSGLSKSTSMKRQCLRSHTKALSLVYEERRKRLVIAVLDLIAHWLQVKDLKLIHDVWDSLPLHERTFDRMLRVCLQCDLTAVKRARRHQSRRRTRIVSSDEEEDAGGEGEQSTGIVGLRQRYMIVPDPKRRFPFPKGVDPGHDWTKVICRMLGAMYGFKAQYVHQLWTEAGGDICEVERQLEGRKTGWLDLHGLGLGDIPRPWD